MLLKVYCSFYSRYNFLIKSVCFRVRPMKKKELHGNYREKIQSGKCSPWYMKITWKMQYQFANVKIADLRDSTTRLQLYATTILAFCTLYFLHQSTWLVFKICWRRVTTKTLLRIINKLTYSLSSRPQYKIRW